MAAAAASSSSTLSWLNLRKPRPSWVPPHRPPSASFLRPAATLREAESSTSLATTWRKVQGADNWTGLVEPLSPLLRDVLVHYGELAMACYKAFDLDPASPTHLRCKYRKPRFMAEVGLGAAGYEVTRYVYATPPGIGLPSRRHARWIGYVAVSSDAAWRRLGRRDVLVAFRGTATGGEWAANLMSSLAPANLDPAGRGVEVESGFLGLYTAGASTGGPGSCREQLLGEVRRLVREHEGEETSITLAGHSMGSALAVLLGYDLAELGVAGAAADHQVPVTVYSFGGPRVGNGIFKERCEELGVKVLRVANVHDPVTKLPGLFMNERRRPWPRWSSSCYAHVGVELAVECSGRRNPMRAHDLETYLGLLRSPKMVEVEEEELQAWPWQVRNLVQSLGLI